MGEVNPALIRWFTDGERRYGKTLWKLASVSLKAEATTPSIDAVKSGEGGLEVAIRSRGQRRVESRLHPFTAISPACEVHANHNQAHNSAAD